MSKIDLLIHQTEVAPFEMWREGAGIERESSCFIADSTFLATQHSSKAD